MPLAETRSHVAGERQFHDSVAAATLCAERRVPRPANASPAESTTQPLARAGQVSYRRNRNGGLQPSVTGTVHRTSLTATPIGLRRAERPRSRSRFLLRDAASLLLRPAVGSRRSSWALGHHPLLPDRDVGVRSRPSPSERTRRARVTGARRAAMGHIPRPGGSRFPAIDLLSPTRHDLACQPHGVVIELVRRVNGDGPLAVGGTRRAIATPLIRAQC